MVAQRAQIKWPTAFQIIIWCACFRLEWGQKASETGKMEMSAVQAWQNISRTDSKCLLTSVGHSLQKATDLILNMMTVKERLLSLSIHQLSVPYIWWAKYKKGRNVWHGNTLTWKSAITYKAKTMKDMLLSLNSPNLIAINSSSFPLDECMFKQIRTQWTKSRESFGLFLSASHTGHPFFSNSVTLAKLRLSVFQVAKSRSSE